MTHEDVTRRTKCDLCGIEILLVEAGGRIFDLDK